LTNKEFAERLRNILNRLGHAPLNKMIKELINELDPPKPECGEAILWRPIHDDGSKEPWSNGVAAWTKEGIYTSQGYVLYGEIEWKPAYVALSDTNPGTEALIDELYNRIVELEERQLKPNEVAVKVPPVWEWPRWADRFIVIFSDVSDHKGTIITRKEAEAREAER